MDITSDQLQKLACKLIEVFSHQGPRRYGFERYWPLAGPVETFSEQAANPVEQEVAKALLSALRVLLKQTAPKSFHLDAASVAVFLKAASVEPSPWRRRRVAHRRSRQRTG